MSSVGAQANSGTTPVREGYEFSEANLERWMLENVAGFAGLVGVSQFRGGQSNPTYRIDTPARRYVLRRKPPGTLLKGAHAIEREARVVRALGEAGFAVPHIHGLCDDDSVIGTWFYVMDMVEGRIFWDAALSEIPAADRPAYFDAMNATIAALHTFDPRVIGLGDYGRAGNYFERQVTRWTRQYRDNPAAGTDPAMDALIDWLNVHLPSDEDSRIVHGDFRVDNMIFHPSEPRVIAVLDWELSTLGHPLADFAYHAMMYHMPPHIVAGLAGADLHKLNIPDEQAYVAAYCRRTGRTDIPAYRFYLAFNFFRLAAIFHGIAGRVLQGTAASEHAAERARHFPELAHIGAVLAGA